MSADRLRLSKHHGAGNDFLVLVDPEGRRPLSGPEARALCDRHLGVGADGVMRVRRGGDGVIVMDLHNADGSIAEMSGNGIRCLVQAAVEAGLAEPGTVEVDTAAGRRAVEYRAGAAPGTAYARVAMGPAVLEADRVLEALARELVPKARSVQKVLTGNPHLVVLLDEAVDDATVADAGSRLETAASGGVNVEFVWPAAGAGDLAMRVWERGVGETMACGTGSCAAAAAARAWGLAGDEVVVHNPGGPLDVALGPAGAVLGGPTVHVASVELDEAVLSSLVGALAADEGTQKKVAAPS